MIKEDKQCLENNVNVPGPMITMPDSGTFQAKTHGFLPLPSILSSAATTATIITGLKISSPLSFGQLCDDGCNLMFNK